MRTNKRERRGGIRAGGLVLAAAAMVLLGAAAGSAQDCEVPLFVKQGTVDPNVMILFDNSGSMNEAMFHPDYNPNIVYTGANGSTTTRFTPTTTYNVSTSGNRTPRNFSASLPSTPSAYLVTSDRGQSGRYIGNYLNWVYFHATAAQRGAIPRFTRVQVAKMVMTDIIKRSRNVRFGLTRFNTDDGGTVVYNCGRDTTTLRQTINNIAATTWTPTGETLEDILNYYKGTGPNRPITQPCQWNFCIVMTDGLPTMDRDVSSYLWNADGGSDAPGNCASIGAPYPEDNYCSNLMADVAYYMRHTDLRSDLAGDQTVITYTIGFGVDGGLLDETARNGDGFYLNANNATELWLSLSRVMQDIVTRISSGAAVAVVSTERGDDDRLYRGKFMPGLWRGFLESFALPYEEGATPVWEAGSILAYRDPGNRQLFTSLGGTVIDWDQSHAADVMTAMGIADPDTAQALVNWTRGYETPTFRDRDGWRLGDIIHSTPVVVGAPNFFSTDPTYQEFYAEHRTRPKTIYVGANDGMLHAFSAESGEELWAYIPEFALPKLKTIADSSYCHTYTCDLTPSVRDVKIGSSWHTILATGGGEGGNAYFAIDVTEPSAPGFLWEVALAGNGPSQSEVEFAQIGGRPVVLVGSGLDATTYRAYLTAIDVETGTILGRQLLSTGTGGRNKATTPKAIDRDFDGDTDVVYVGDMLGNMWRFTPESDGNPDEWDMQRLFSTSQPITAAPAVAYAENDQLNVYFGTGAYLEDSDVTNTGAQSFYCVFDDLENGGYTRSSLRDQTDEAEDIGNARGWFLDLEHRAGERVTERAVIVAGTTYFTSFAPSSAACEAGGWSWFYHVNYATGGEPDVEDEYEGTATASRSEELGEGIASRPVVDIINENIIVQSSDASITVQDIGAAVFHLTVRSWQENYDMATDEEAANNQ